MVYMTGLFEHKAQGLIHSDPTGDSKFSAGFPWVTGSKTPKDNSRSDLDLAAVLIIHSLMGRGYDWNFFIQPDSKQKYSLFWVLKFKSQ